jgi:sugar/nucleoside kinase (ribokinase family)
VLDANGADNSKLQWVGGHSGTTISISTSSDRAFLSYAGANILLPARLDDYAVAKWLTQAQHVHFAMALPRSVALRLLPLLRRAETTVSIDPGWQPAWYDDEANRATCREVDIFLPNEKEAAYIVGSTQQDKKPEEISAAVLRMGFANAVIKLGSKGAIATIGKSCRVCAPAVQVVDTTGAGDAFDAGVIDVFLEGATVEAMLRRGCLLGSLSTCAAGALQGLPRRQQIEEEYERVYKS